MSNDFRSCLYGEFKTFIQILIIDLFKTNASNKSKGVEWAFLFDFLSLANAFIEIFYTNQQHKIIANVNNNIVE